ncbi:MAG: hypothetical protein ACI8W3_003565 [Myxococcota bacterium]|jgi:hypothetical protein
MTIHIQSRTTRLSRVAAAIEGLHSRPLKRAAKLLYWAATGQLSVRVRERRQARELRRSGLFDVEYYLRTHPDVARHGMDPHLHYIVYSAAEGRNPNPLFDTTYYLENNPDVAGTNTNALIHYLRFGAAEGRKPSPLFDPVHYAKNFPEAKGNLLRHYFKDGVRTQLAPTPFFDASWYAARYPEVDAAQGSAFLHYVQNAGQ